MQRVCSLHPYHFMILEAEVPSASNVCCSSGSYLFRELFAVKHQITCLQRALRVGVRCVVAILTIAHLFPSRLVGVTAAKMDVGLPLLVSCFSEVLVLFQPKQEMKKVIFVDSLVPGRWVCTHSLSPGPAYRHHFNGVVEVQPA